MARSKWRHWKAAQALQTKSRGLAWGRRLVARGLLVSDSKKGPVRLGFPVHKVERWFPKLYPADLRRAAQQYPAVRKEIKTHPNIRTREWLKNNRYCKPMCRRHAALPLALNQSLIEI